MHAVQVVFDCFLDLHFNNRFSQDTRQRCTGGDFHNILSLTTINYTIAANLYKHHMVLRKPSI